MGAIVTITFLLCIITITHGLHKRIYKGSEAPEGKHLYHALITNRWGAYCGGSVIDKRWILTAAHCFPEDHIRDIKVQVGSRSRLGRSRKIFRIEKRVTHEAFNPTNVRNDIALFRVDKDIEFNDKVQPITLANRDTTIDDNENVEFAGFGRLVDTARPHKLQTVVLKMYGYSKCKDIEPRVTEMEICTLATEGKGPCVGDSGGALVNDYGFQVGIDSHGFGPCGEVPEIYTRVSLYRDWIDAKIREN